MYKTMPRPRGPPKRGGAKVSGRGAYKAKAPAKPRSSAVRGRGFYKGFASDVGYGLGRLGNALTGRNDLHIGGAAAGSAFSKVTGLGAYAMNRNTLVQQVPEIANAKSKEGATIVRHKEYICDISGSSAFTIHKTIEMNPGLVASFPWASQIANAYEEWELLGCLVEFVSTSGNATGSNTALGELMISSEYNSYNPLFTSKQQMLNQIFAVSGPPSINLTHAIECSPAQSQVTRFYVRNGTTTLPIVLTDLCRTSVATQGNQSTNILGELWLTFELALYKPRLGQQGPPPVPTPTTRVFNYNATTQGLLTIERAGDYPLDPYPQLLGSFVIPDDFDIDLNPQFVNGDTPNNQVTFNVTFPEIHGGVGNQGNSVTYYNAVRIVQKSEYDLWNSQGTIPAAQRFGAVSHLSSHPPITISVPGGGAWSYIDLSGGRTPGPYLTWNDPATAWPFAPGDTWYVMVDWYRTAGTSPNEAKIANNTGPASMSVSFSYLVESQVCGWNK